MRNTAIYLYFDENFEPCAAPRETPCHRDAGSWKEITTEEWDAIEAGHAMIVFNPREGEWGENIIIEASASTRANYRAGAYYAGGDDDLAPELDTLTFKP